MNVKGLSWFSIGLKMGAKGSRGGLAGRSGRGVWGRKMSWLYVHGGSSDWAVPNTFYKWLRVSELGRVFFGILKGLRRGDFEGEG
jgi:hypothetical protein